MLALIQILVAPVCVINFAGTILMVTIDVNISVRPTKRPHALLRNTKAAFGLTTVNCTFLNMSFDKPYLPCAIKLL